MAYESLVKENENDINIEEVSLIIFLLNRDNHNKYASYISKMPLEKETKTFTKLVASYYDEHPEVQGIDVENLMVYFTVKHPVLKRRTTYQEYLSRFGKVKVDNELLKKNFNIILEKYFAAEIVGLLTDVLSGEAYDIMDYVKDKLEEFDTVKNKIDNLESVFVESNLASLLEEEVTTPGISWRLNCLNKDLGSLRGGTLGHVFARVDTGKTSFLASEATYMASQLKDDETIVWFNNEEKGTKVQLRVYQSALNCSKQQLVDYEADAEAEFKRLCCDRIKIYDSFSISIDDIDHYIKECNARIVIIDQGDKIKFSGDKEYSLVERLKMLYGKFRELAKKHNCDIITVGQAAALAEGKKWLQTDFMDNSKTGKPGELDYAIGIGRVYQDENTPDDTMRYISLCKNKMHTGVHGRYDVYFDGSRARYQDVASSGFGALPYTESKPNKSLYSSTSNLEYLLER